MQSGTPNEPTSPAPATEEPAAAPDATPTPAPVAKKTSNVKQEGGKLRLAGPVTFETGKAVLTPESEPTLEDLKVFLEQKSQITLLRLEGHTDNTGAEPGRAARNLALSGERAKAVRTWLVNRGIAPQRLVSVGFGETKPIADNGTEQGRNQNRRTEYVVVEVGGNPWLGADRTGGGTVFE